MSELLKINVNEHTEKKNGLTYLSWAWAWAEVLKLDPLAVWVPLQFGPKANRTPYLQLPDGSMMVGVHVQMKGNGRSCMLPVMDHRNKAIKNPDAFAVNTAMMRCLAKAIAMHGLGLYIYAGEDVPESTDEKKDEHAKLTDGQMADWLSAIADASHDELGDVLKAALDQATVAKDREAYMAFRTAAKTRSEKVSA